MIEINADKHNLSQLGKRNESTDSLTHQQFKFSSLADILNLTSQVYIKSYGPGAVASTAFRGGNASQTAVLWNGFNLQNAMLGQADLALIPSIMFDNIAVEYGGSSSLWGSGAVGGSIHLNNNGRFGQGFKSAVSLGAGSFNTFSGATSISYSKAKFATSTKLSLINSKNNYTYRDALDKENPMKRQLHATYSFINLMQEFKFIINRRQILTTNAWVSSNHRQLPGFNQTVKSKSSQNDNAVRLNAGWTYQAARFKSAVRGAMFADKINYTDSLLNIFSKSKATTYSLENENYFDWAGNNQLNVGFSYLNSKAFSNNYYGSKGISRVSLLVGNKFSFFQKKLTAYTSLRAEYFSVGSLPVTGNVSVEYKLLRNLLLSVNAARVYRQPTLNELYWDTPVRLNLKPEQGYTFEGSIANNIRFGHISLVLSGSVYSRNINDWILWVPRTSGGPSPINIQKVWSRGAETSSKIEFKKRKLRLACAVMSAYVLSTVGATYQSDNASRGRQLIYTPRYSFNTNFNIGYDKINLGFYHNYTGYRFITSDNTAWLNPYHVSSVRLTHSTNYGRSDFLLHAACNNLFNRSYTVIAARPMPLRNFEIGITIKHK